MFKKKILVIDDTELMVRLISDILEKSGYEVVFAYNGAEGIKKVREDKPDLVILDIIMPELDGFEVCKILRDDESNNLMPIIMLTAKGNEEDKLKGLELGADDYIIKPFNPRELTSRVNNTLKRIDRNRRVNPLTGLQGNIEIQTEINRRVAKKSLFSVIYADLDNFKAYNDVYGFISGDRAIKLTADIITDTVRLYGTGRDFIGHIGGDDFIVVSSPENIKSICEGIIKDFDEKVQTLYSCDDLVRGYIITVSRTGGLIKYPIMSISMVAVSNEYRDISSHLQVAEIAAGLKKRVKLMPGSVYLKDGRQ